jgi:hypothetical protein
MSGFVYDPLQTISLIADNDRDRYRDETAVVKEIIQNADDATADRADFIIVNNGIPSNWWHGKNRSLVTAARFQRLPIFTAWT